MSAISQNAKHLSVAKISVSLLCLGTLLVFAAPPTNNYYSISNGDYETSGVWSTTSSEGASCGCSPSCTLSGSKSVTISDTVTNECATFQTKGNSEIRIIAPGHLIINGDLELSGNSEFIIDPNATLTIYGDLSVGGSSEMVVDGTLLLNGDASTSGSGSVCGQGTVQVTGSTSGSGWCFSDQTLPIKLLSFNATLTEQQDVELNWATAVEVNNDFFRIERSQNGMNFTTLAEVAGSGNSKQRQDYSHIDRHPGTGTFYYRLSQFDYDGQSETFDLVAVSLSDDEAGSCVLTVIPNPCVPNCRAELANCSDPTIETYIMDANGTMIRKLIPANTSSNGYTYSISRDNFLMPGVYVINSRSAGLNTAKKIIVR